MYYKKLNNICINFKEIKLENFSDLSNLVEVYIKFLKTQKTKLNSLVPIKISMLILNFHIN